MFAKVYYRVQNFLLVSVSALLYVVCSIFLHLDQNCYPYKIAMVQKLNESELESQVLTCQILLQLVNKIGLLNFLVMSDEAHFELSGRVNNQNFRYRS